MSSEPYDVKFTVSGKVFSDGSDTAGFMCVTPEGQSKQLLSDEVGGPNAERISTEETFTHQDFNPRHDTPLVQSTWVGGAGQLEWEDDSRFWWSSGVVSRVDGKIFLAPPVTVSSQLSSATTYPDGFRTWLSSTNRYDFCWVGTRLYRRRDDESSWTLIYTASVAITDIQFIDGDCLICVPTHAVSSYLRQANPAAAATWSPTGVAVSILGSGNRPKLMKVVRNTTFAFVDTNKVYFSVDISSATSWAGPIETEVASISKPQLGSETYTFVSSLAVNDYLFAFKQDAGWNIDSEQNVSEVIWQWRDRPSVTNFKHVSTAGELLIFSAGPDVHTYDPGTGALVPMKLSRHDGFSVREILGVAGDNNVAYVLARVRVPVLRSADSVALFRMTRMGTRWLPEVLWEDPDLTNQTYYGLGAFAHGSATILHWGLNDNGAGKVVTMTIPADWDSSTAGSFASAGHLYTSIAHSGFPGLFKRHLYFVAESLGCGASTSPDIDVEFSTDGGATFTSLGNIDSDDEIFEFDNVQSKKIVFHFILNANTGETATPQLRVFDHHQRVRFRYLPLNGVGVRIADNIELANGTRDGRSVADLVSDIEMLRTCDDEEILYEDFLGHSYNVTVDSLGFRPTRHYRPEDRNELECLMGVARADKGA